MRRLPGEARGNQAGPRSGGAGHERGAGRHAWVLSWPGCTGSCRLLPGLGSSRSRTDSPAPAASPNIAAISTRWMRPSRCWSGRCSWLERNAPPSFEPCLPDPWRLPHRELSGPERRAHRPCSTGSSPASAIRSRIWAGCWPRCWRFGAYGPRGRRHRLARPRSSAATRPRAAGRSTARAPALLGGHGDRALGGDRAAAGRTPLFRGRALARAGPDRPCRCPGAGARPADHASTAEIEEPAA